MSPSKIIQPSEILSGREEKRASSRNKSMPEPWVRFVARMFDYSLLFLAIHLIQMGTGQSDIIPDFPLPLELAIWVPIEALFLYLFKATPGKMVLGAKVESQSGKLTFQKAFSRSASVWIRGMGLGLYLISVFTMFHAYNNLIKLKRTTWDRDEKTLYSQKKASPFRLYISLLFILACYILRSHY